MKRIIEFFTGNWGLKLLAFILAIVVYCSMKDSLPSNDRTGNPSVFLKGPVNGGK